MLSSGSINTMRIRTTQLITIILLAILPAVTQAQSYPWLSGSSRRETVAERFMPPPGYSPVAVAPGSFARWLRDLPLKPEGSPVKLFDGRTKGNQKAQVAVVEIDVGSQDLQQCADAVIRLRAEYLYSRGLNDSIAFTFTSGDTASWRAWVNGQRPLVKGNQVTWQQSAAVDSTYQNFKQYLKTVFMYAGTISLLKDSSPKWSICDIAAGDFFADPGSPGHAVLVVDVAEDTTTGRKMFLLAQSYMPAQDVHILANPKDSTVSPWYPCACEDRLITPEWTFSCDELRQF